MNRSRPPREFLELLRTDAELISAFWDGFAPFLPAFDILFDDPETAIRTPHTFRYQLQQAAVDAIESHGPEHLVERMLDVYRIVLRRLGWDAYMQVADWLVNTYARFIKSSAAEDRRYSMLTKLAQRADARVDAISLLVFGAAPPFKDTMFAALLPAGDLADAETTITERRAEHVRRAIQSTAESNYGHFLKSVVLLCGVIEDRPRRPANKLGSLVNQAGAALNRVNLGPFPHLVDPDAAWLRNSTAHCFGFYWKYVPNKDAVEVRDRSHGPKVMPVDIALAKAQAMWMMSSITYDRVRMLQYWRRFNRETVMQDWIEAIGCAAMGNDARGEAVMARARDKVEHILMPAWEYVIGLDDPVAQAFLPPSLLEEDSDATENDESAKQANHAKEVPPS